MSGAKFAVSVVVSSGQPAALYVNETRVAGPKPLLGRAAYEWTVDAERLVDALTDAGRAALAAHEAERAP